jgi:hypothetical protein
LYADVMRLLCIVSSTVVDRLPRAEYLRGMDRLRDMVRATAVVPVSVLASPVVWRAHFLDGNRTEGNVVPREDNAPPNPNADMGGNDFGLNDGGGSWDDNSGGGDFGGDSGGGDDWT